jgi:hypothetical protein
MCECHHHLHRMCECHHYFDTSFLTVLDHFLPTRCRCRGLLLNLITLNDAYTFVRTPLDEGSDRSRDLYLHNTQLSQEPDIHASGGIRIHNPSKRVAAYVRLWPRGQRDRPCGYMGIYRSVLLHAALFRV